MQSATILKFPFERVSPETYKEGDGGTVLIMPTRPECPIALLPVVLATQWMKMWGIHD